MKKNIETKKKKKKEDKSWHYKGGHSFFESSFYENLGDFLLNFRTNQPNMTKTVLKF